MNRAVEIAIAIASRASTAGFHETADAARTMRDDVQDAASSAAGGLDRVSGAAENMDDKAGKATGALGALSAGFELVGLEQYATGLQNVAMATDFVSGVGQTMSLLLELESFQRAKAAAAAVAHAAATTAGAAAAKVAAGAQAALNAVMAANPVLLVVLAVVALIAVFVLAYRKSSEFRAIVQAAMAGARTAVGWVVDKVSDLVGWITGRAVAAWSTLRDAVSAALSAVRDKFQPVLDAAQRVFDKVKTVIGDAIDVAKEKVEFFKDKAGAAFDALMTPINAVKDAIGWIIDKFDSIKPPKWLNALPGVDFRAPAMVPGLGPSSGGAAPVTINLNVAVSPLTDPSSVAAAILAAIQDYLARVGRQVVIA